MKNNQDHLNLMRQINIKPTTTQRELAKNFRFSLGKLNYCLKALKEKGMVKINNFKKDKTRSSMCTRLHQKGISYRTKLTINFMKRKFKEYDELQKELKIINKKK